jgi:hypothetical protein
MILCLHVHSTPQILNFCLLSKWKSFNKFEIFFELFYNTHTLTHTHMNFPDTKSIPHFIQSSNTFLCKCSCGVLVGIQVFWFGVATMKTKNFSYLIGKKQNWFQESDILLTITFFTSTLSTKHFKTRTLQ